MSLLVDRTDPALGNASTRREELAPALAELSPWERKVLSLRYLAGLDEFDVGRRWVSR
jgi:DNA-directed RNA polymerase specialized sigma24 family protein